jgi:hypothetical protein
MAGRSSKRRRSVSTSDAAAGLLLDATANKLLLVDSDRTTVKAYDRASKQYISLATDLPVWTSAYPYPQLWGRLAPVGALFFLQRLGYPNDLFLYPWSSGQPAAVIAHPGWFDFNVPFALWGAPNGPYSLVRIELGSAGATTPIPTPLAIARGPLLRTEGEPSPHGAVGPNGDVVYVSGPGDLYRWRDGSTTKLTTGIFEPSPLTDGINVIGYRKADPHFDITLTTSSGDVALSTLNYPDLYDLPRPGRNYQVTSGWAAFNSLWGGALQIYVRDPTGATSRITQFGGKSVLDALDGNGNVALLQGGSRYLASPTTPAFFISGEHGTAISIDGAWYLMLGRSLFAVTGTAGSGCGARVPPSGGGRNTSDGCAVASVADGGAPCALVVFLCITLLVRVRLRRCVSTPTMSTLA